MSGPARSTFDRPLTGEQTRELLQRVEQGPLFVRSPALRAFLNYIVENAIAGNWELIKEQSIGAAALGRGPNYDPATDNIVRVRAHELRQKLEKHFETVGIHEPVVISVPRGTYIPEFHFRNIDPPQTTDTRSPEVELPKPETSPAVVVAAPGSRWIWRLVPWLLVVALSAALAFTLLHYSDRHARGEGGSSRNRPSAISGALFSPSRAGPCSLFRPTRGLPSGRI